MKEARLHFFGAASTVTGSKTLLETDEVNILVDCGMFQGLKELRLLNWRPIPFDAARIDYVLLTHGHLDHVGYLAEGTRGRQLQEGAHEVKIRGKYYPVKAEVKHVESLSAHADQKGLMDWLDQIVDKPKKVFLVHGEPTALDVLRVKLKDSNEWDPIVPRLNEVHPLDI